MKTHWTNRSLEDYAFSIAADFIVQLENKMEDQGLSQDELAKKMGRSKGRISQVLNKPGNFKLLTAVEYSKALNMKVALVAYEDSDSNGENRPINSVIFKLCWEKCGKPKDFWSLQETIQISDKNYVDQHTFVQLAQVANKEVIDVSNKVVMSSVPNNNCISVAV